MRLAFWIVFFASFALAALAMNATLVILLTFRSGYLLAPLWPIAANLWWVMLLLAPVAWHWPRGRFLTGIALSFGLAVAGAGGFYGLRALAFAGIEAPLVTTPGAFANGKPQPAVVEVVVNADSVLGEAACDALCERLLTGDSVTTLRRITGDGIPRVFRRMDPGACQALDPDFAVAEPCILLVPDDRQVADLRITVDGEGDGFASRDELAALVYLVSARRLRVTSVTDGVETVLHDQSQRTWIEATAPVPLFPDAGFDGNGIHGGGLATRRERKSDPPLDAAAILASLGLAMGPGRTFIETEPAQAAPNGVYLAAKGRYEPAAYDVALIASVLEADGAADESVFAIVYGWLGRLGAGGQNTETTRALIDRLPAFLGNRTFVLEKLSKKRPELFVDRFADFYPQVQNGTEEEARLAASAILNRVRADAFGTHDADAEAYLAALQSGKQWGYLIQIVGRYGFDPTPILQTALDRSPDGQNGADLDAIFDAACRSDPKWNATLGPFLHQALLPLVDDLVSNRDSFRDGTAALQVLGRSDLVDDLFARVDWTAIIAREGAAGYNTRPLEFVQQGYFRRDARPNDC